MRRRWIIYGLTIVVTLCLVAWFWPRQNLNVLLITLDTTRADRLGCYGYSGARTPVLDRLASEGVLFERAYTVAPLTLPAHASLFTGLYPQEHGLRTNGRGRLDQNLPTLASQLKEAGYDTGAFVASFVLDSKFGLDEGFQVYDDEFTSVEPAHDALHRQRHADSVIDSALKWLRQPRARPFFCWVHLYDPHAPYLDHRELFREEFRERPYDAEIAFIDLQIDRLLAHLKSNRSDEKTLLIIVGDHGEGLGEHAELRHGQTLYNSTMHVPLLVSLPYNQSAVKRVREPVSLVDLSPTILEYAGCRVNGDVSGKSLCPLLAGQPRNSRPCYGATDEPYLESGWAPLRSLIDGEWKFINTTRPELYHLTTDPQELNNLFATDTENADRMLSLQTDFESTLTTRVAAEIQLSSRERQVLATLGYLGGESDLPKDFSGNNLPDVKDMLPFEAIVEDAEKLIESGKLDEAVVKLRSVIQDVPAHTAANWALAQALARQDKNDESLLVLRTFVELRPDSFQGRLGLGLTLLPRDLSAGIAELRQACKLDPERPEAPYNLALALMDQQNFSEALKLLTTTIENDPQHTGAYQWRAYLLTQKGDFNAALADYRLWLKYSPDSSDAHLHLARQLFSQGDSSEAEQLLARAEELAPQSPQLQLALGKIRWELHQPDLARQHIEKALQLRPDWPEAVEWRHRLRDAQ